MLINVVLLAIIFGAGYWFWLRPILKTTPFLEHFFVREDTFLQALSGKFAGIKQRLSGALIILAGIYVELANYVMPALTGVDTSTWTKNLPDWMVPLIPIAAVALLNYFRSLADRRDPPPEAG